jgi:DNA-binding GntR family transcriptional regulator
MTLTGKLIKGESLSYQRIVHQFNVSRDVAHGVISQLKRDGLVISKRRVGSFVTRPLTNQGRKVLEDARSCSLRKRS